VAAAGLLYEGCLPNRGLNEDAVAKFATSLDDARRSGIAPNASLRAKLLSGLLLLIRP